MVAQRNAKARGFIATSPRAISCLPLTYSFILSIVYTTCFLSHKVTPTMRSIRCPTSNAGHVSEANEQWLSTRQHRNGAHMRFRASPPVKTSIPPSKQLCRMAVGQTSTRRFYVSSPTLLLQFHQCKRARKRTAGERTYFFAAKAINVCINGTPHIRMCPPERRHPKKAA